MKKIVMADLFCGAGGTSTGAILAAKELNYKMDLTAINHWDIAIDTHSTNHPEGRHLAENLDHVIPTELFPSGKLNLLCASPECTNHSNAKAGKPRSEQSRATAWKVVEWANYLYIENILIENVKEFRDWGPLDDNGKPVEALKGRTFVAFINTLKSLGYAVEHKVVVCANFGDPTTRERLFIMCKKKGSIKWPQPTHSNQPANNLLPLKPWIPAREIIDWSIKGPLLEERKVPLKEKTLKRIEHGIRKFCTPDFVEPFLVVLRGQSSVRSIDLPTPTITTSGGHLALCEPFIVKQRGTSKSASIEEPLHAVTTSGTHHYLCEPFIISYYGKGKSNNIDDPLPTVTTKDRFGLVTPEWDGVELGIRYRMLEPHELAAAMGFPKDYKFQGNKTAIKKQIGNAVPISTAKAHVKALLAS